MSDLKAKSIEIELNGKVYGAVFTLNVIDDLQSTLDKPINEILDMVTNPMDSIHATKVLLTSMINEWIDIQRELGNTEYEYVTEKYVGRYLDFAKFTNKAGIAEAIGSSLPESNNSPNQ